MIFSILGIAFAVLLAVILFAPIDLLGILYGKGSGFVFTTPKLPFFMFILQAEIIPLLKGINPILGFLLAGMSLIIGALWRSLKKKEEQERETFIKVTELLINVSQSMEEDKRLRTDVQKLLIETSHNWQGITDLRSKVERALEIMRK